MMTEKDTEVKQFDPTEEQPETLPKQEDDSDCCEDPKSCPCSK